MKRMHAIFLVAVIVLGGVVATHGASIPVQDITISFGMVPFYQGGIPGYFQVPNSSSVIANLQTLGASGFDYGISANVTVTPCYLESNAGSGSLALGNFYGGATMTITGNLWNVADPGTLIVSNGVILQATMVPTSAQTWVLSEDAGLPGNLDASVYFTPSGSEGLSSGIELANGDKLVIGGFRADFGFPNIMPFDPSSFGTTGYMAIGSTLQMTAIPEPATLLLLAIGGLSVMRIKRK